MFYIDLKFIKFMRRKPHTLDTAIAFFFFRFGCRRRPSKKKRHEIIEIIKLTDLKGLRDIIFMFSLIQSVLEKSVSI